LDKISGDKMVKNQFDDIINFTEKLKNLTADLTICNASAFSYKLEDLKKYIENNKNVTNARNILEIYDAIEHWDSDIDFPELCKKFNKLKNKLARISKAIKDKNTRLAKQISEIMENK